jgi:hypothetical protein
MDALHEKQKKKKSDDRLSLEKAPFGFDLAVKRCARQR